MVVSLWVGFNNSRQRHPWITLFVMAIDILFKMSMVMAMSKADEGSHLRLRKFNGSLTQ